ncbi:hypothetical protein FRC03_010080 [Tulasnella sp. 419]|nr:hypothetical protein FRC03_010080 [Tulasnella sp. 419]
MSTTAQSLSSFATTIKKTVQLFQPELLRTENGRENAQISLKALARTCQEGDPKYHLAFLEGLLVSEIGVLEYIYAKDSNVARIIRVIVLAEHSANDPSCENAMWYRTLLRLDDFYLRLPPTIEFPNYQKLANSQQIAMKYRQTGLRKNSFDYMDEMARLKSIVKFYLETLADIAQTLVTMYEQEPPKEQPNQDPPEMDTVPPTDLPESVAVGLQDEVKSPSEHIKRHPLRAAALFDAGSGQLGHWPILFSSKGYSHWRQLGTADAAIHKIVHRKITSPLDSSRMTIRDI